jgi:hypothetical protein
MEARGILRFFSVLVFLGYCSQAYSTDVLVNRPESANDSRYDYAHQLLQMVLDETQDEFPKCTVTYADHVMSRDRLLLSLKDGAIHVVAEAPKVSWLKALQVIRIPIRKGMQGYRLFFINKRDQAMLSKITTLGEFKTHPTGSGAGWSTAGVMRKAGFNVIEGNNYDGLFSMLERGRFTTFGRGVNEIEAEFQAQKGMHPELSIETDFVLHIPLPTYFFVSPKYPGLAERVEKGLWRLINNGKFEAYFLKHHQALIDRFRLKERTVFSIPNPNLSKADPLDNKKLWHTF